MNHLIRKVDFPPTTRTGVIEERELFAKMMEEERARRHSARWARIKARLRAALAPRSAFGACRRTEPPIPAPGNAAHIPATSP